MKPPVIENSSFRIAPASEHAYGCVFRVDYLGYGKGLVGRGVEEHRGNLVACVHEGILGHGRIGGLRGTAGFAGFAAVSFG